MNKAILIHGRHLQTEEWEKMVWGVPPHNLGTLPRAVLEMLIRGPENIAQTVVGTGASEKDGVKEAEAMKQYLCQHFDRVGEFNAIATHPRFQTQADKEVIRELCDWIVCEITSQNTKEEIVAAGQIFADAECNEVYQVTGGSHLPRAALSMLEARAAGSIPTDQLWYPIGDDMTYEGTDVSDVVVAEPPHRGDRPKAPIHKAVKMANSLGRKPEIADEFTDALTVFAEKWKEELEKRKS